MEQQAKDNAKVLLFVHDKETRSLASMVEVGEWSAVKKQKLVLAIEELGDQVMNEKLSERYVEMATAAVVPFTTKSNTPCEYLRNTYRKNKKTHPIRQEEKARNRTDQTKKKERKTKQTRLHKVRRRKRQAGSHKVKRRKRQAGSDYKKKMEECLARPSVGAIYVSDCGCRDRLTRSLAASPSHRVR